MSTKRKRRRDVPTPTIEGARRDKAIMYSKLAEPEKTEMRKIKLR
jgi:hypothetical protein